MVFFNLITGHHLDRYATDWVYSHAVQNVMPAIGDAAINEYGKGTWPYEWHIAIVEATTTTGVWVIESDSGYKPGIDARFEPWDGTYFISAQDIP